MRTRVKICCMASFEEAQLAIQLGAEAVGLVGAMPSGPGGLSAVNVAEAIRRVRPFGVDLCSGVRTEGRLDSQKLAAFMEAVRQADRR
jgi:phosphoribosylanthranilate isomerase